MSSPYQSSTRQHPSVHAWTFAGIAVEPNGTILAAERNALRDIKPKGLLVRYANPFESPGVAPEVLYESSDAFTKLHLTPGGAIHLAGKNKHHFQEKGKWKSKAVPSGVLTGIGSYGARLLLTTGWPSQCFEWTGAGYDPIPWLGKECDQLIGGEDTGLYAPSGDGLAYFDGSTWALLEGAPRSGNVLIRSKDEVLATGFGASLYRGNHRDGFKEVVPDGGHLSTRGTLTNIAWAHEHIYITQTHGVERGIYRVDGDHLEHVFRATGYCGESIGDREFLWHSNGVELMCFNGKEWRSVERVHNDKTKW